jgi:hypothetical protein
LATVSFAVLLGPEMKGKQPTADLEIIKGAAQPASLACSALTRPRRVGARE